MRQAASASSDFCIFFGPCIDGPGWVVGELTLCILHEARILSAALVSCRFPVCESLILGSTVCSISTTITCSSAEIAIALPLCCDGDVVGVTLSCRSIVNFHLPNLDHDPTIRSLGRGLYSHGTGLPLLANLHQETPAYWILACWCSWAI